MENITKNIAHLRKLKSVSQEHMADDLGITRSKLGSYEEGRANPPIPILIKLSDYFKLPIDILLKNDLTKSESLPSIVIGEQRILFPMTVDQDQGEYIEVVPVKASAGYLNGYGDPEYVESLQKMKLPFMPVGNHRAFPVSGDSMLPVKSGSYVVGRFLEDIRSIKNGRTYVLVTVSEGIVYKRVYNNISENGELLLHSDNKSYSPFSIPAQEVMEVWEFTCLINTQEYSEQDLNLDSIMSMMRELKIEMADIKKSK
jgi:transcriptional regulator with XRE-family HTH domain